MSRHLFAPSGQQLSSAACRGCRHVSWRATWVPLWHCCSMGVSSSGGICCPSRTRKVSGSREIPDSSYTAIGPGLPAIQKSAQVAVTASASWLCPSEISVFCTHPHLNSEFHTQKHGNTWSACQNRGTSRNSFAVAQPLRWCALAGTLLARGLFLSGVSLADSVPSLRKLSNRKALGRWWGGEGGKASQA